MQEQQQSIVAQWNELLLESIREGGAKPTATTYQLHLVSSAIYDAWASLSDEADGYYSDIATALAQTDENKAEAVSFAAYATLVSFFPAAKDKFDAFMSKNGYDPADASFDPDTAAGLGTLAAKNVLKAREGDGSNVENNFADTSGYVPINSPEPGSAAAPGGADFDPNHWQPLRVPTGTVTDENGVPIIDNNDPDSFVDQIALTPHWGGVDSFALDENDQFRPPAPPQLGDFSVYVDGAGNVTTGDQAYRDQVAEVVEFSAGLTNETKVIAEYWADGPRTESPPGHWNQIAQDIALREGHGIDEDAKLFFALNAAVFDAGIATWEAKYTYDFVRPQSAIRDLFFDQTIEAWAGPNQGTQEILGQEWQPYQNVTFVTPPFPEYVSGHSTFSMAAANTIAAFVGSDVFYDGTTLSNYDLDSVEGRDFVGRYETTELFFEDFGDGPPVVLQWDTLTEAAEEAGISRLYGGIHIQDGNLNGLKLGEQVAEAAAPRWDALFTRGGNDLIVAGPEGGLIIAGGGEDIVIGGDAKDIIEGGSGDDLLVGGADVDTALYSSSQSSYTLTLSLTETTVTDRRPDGDGTDTLIGFEFLDFDTEIPALGGNPLKLEMFGGLTELSAHKFSEIIELYIAYFNRAPDAMGLNFWATAYSNGQPLEEIATLFFDQDETRALYPEGTSSAVFLETIYQNVLGRNFDQGGFDFWENELNSGAVGRDEFIFKFLDGAQGSDVGFLENKVKIGTYFAVTKGMSDSDNAAVVMGLFDGTDASIDDAVAAIDDFYSDALDPTDGEFLMPLVGVLDDPFAMA